MRAVICSIPSQVLELFSSFGFHTCLTYLTYSGKRIWGITLWSPILQSCMCLMRFFFFLLLQAGIGSGVKSNLSYPFHGSELGWLQWICLCKFGLNGGNASLGYGFWDISLKYVGYKVYMCHILTGIVLDNKLVMFWKSSCWRLESSLCIARV